MKAVFSFLIFQTLISALIAWRAFSGRHSAIGGTMAAIALMCVFLLALLASSQGRAARNGKGDAK